METRSVFLVLSGIAVGAVGGYTGSDLTARAGITDTQSHVYRGDVLPAANKSVVEGTNGLVRAAVTHANTQLGLIGADALVLDAGQCPLQAVNLQCYVDQAGVRQYRWEYGTKEMTRTIVFSAPQ